MSVFEDFMLVQKSAIKRSYKSFIKNWGVIFTGLVYMIINVLMNVIVSILFTGALSILAGFATALVSSALISSYLYLLSNIITYDRVTINDFKRGFSEYLWKVYRIFFIAYIVSLTLSLVSNLFGGNAGSLINLIYLLAFILLNALPETIYQKFYSAQDSISYAFEFIKENWFNWFVPNIILFGILYLVTGTVISDLFTTHINFGFNFSLESILRYIVGQSIFTFTMIYRGHLFKILSTSTRRKRAFMGKLED